MEESFNHLIMSTMLVDDYTKKGLFRHLQNHNGRAYQLMRKWGPFKDSCTADCMMEVAGHAASIYRL